MARHGDKNLAFGFRGSTFCSLPGCQDESRTASCHVRETVASNVARHSVLNRKDFYRKQWATVGCRHTCQFERRSIETSLGAYHATIFLSLFSLFSPMCISGRCLVPAAGSGESIYLTNIFPIAAAVPKRTTRKANVLHSIRTPFLAPHYLAADHGLVPPREHEGRYNCSLGW